MIKKLSITVFLSIMIMLNLLCGCVSTKAKTEKKYTHEESDFVGYTSEKMIDYLARGGDIDDQDKHGRTMLHAFTVNGNVEAVEYLLSHGANRDIHDNYDKYPINYADLEEICKKGQIGKLKIYRMLAGEAKYRKDINVISVFVKMPYLSFAISKNQNEIAIALIESGADLDKPDNLDFKEPPLFHAIRSQNFEIFKKLLDAGADPNIVDKENVTPLIFCSGVATASKEGKYAGKGMVEFAALLVKKGALVRMMDIRYWTALHWAARSGLIDLSEFLMRNDANIGGTTNQNKTCFDIARENNQTAWLAYFTEDKVREIKKEKDDKEAGYIVNRSEKLKVYIDNGNSTGKDDHGSVEFSIWETAEYLAFRNDLFIYNPLGKSPYLTTDVEYKIINEKMQNIPEISYEERQNIIQVSTWQFNEKEDGYYLSISQLVDPSTLKTLEKPLTVSYKVGELKHDLSIPRSVLPIAAPSFFVKAPEWYFFTIIDNPTPQAIASKSLNVITDCAAYRQKEKDGGFSISFYYPEDEDNPFLVVYYRKSGEILEVYDGTFVYRAE